MKILFLGILAEVVGKSEIQLMDIENTDSLNSYLVETYPDFQKCNYKIAVNREIIIENRSLDDKDEVAILPAFSGG